MLLTLNEAAERTGLSTHILRRASDRGDLPVYVLPGSGRRRFDPDDLDRWKASLLRKAHP